VTNARRPITGTLAQPTAIVVYIPRHTAITRILQLRTVVIGGAQFRRPVVRFVPTDAFIPCTGTVTVVVAILVVIRLTHLSARQRSRSRGRYTASRSTPLLAVIRGTSMNCVKTFTAQAIVSTHPQVVAVEVGRPRVAVLTINHFTTPVVSGALFGTPVVIHVVTHTFLS
jgi:hypothetical protein